MTDKQDQKKRKRESTTSSDEPQESKTEQVRMEILYVFPRHTTMMQDRVILESEEINDIKEFKEKCFCIYANGVLTYKDQLKTITSKKVPNVIAELLERTFEKFNDSEKSPLNDPLYQNLLVYLKRGTSMNIGDCIRIIADGVKYYFVIVMKGVQFVGKE